MLRRPGSSWEFCAFLLKGISFVVLRVDRALYIHSDTRNPAGPCRDLWRRRSSKYKRGTWNTAFNRAVLLADILRWPRELNMLQIEKTPAN